MKNLQNTTIGILGSGQLGRMLAVAAQRMGVGMQVLSPRRDTPTGALADVEWVAGYDDLAAVGDFARAVDVVTYEFENVPAETAVLEAWAGFEREVSVAAARGLGSSFAHYGLIANDHVNHILDVSVAPVLVGSEVSDQWPVRSNQ